MIELSPTDCPVTTRKTTIFLAGAIDQGRAENWQQSVIAQLGDLDVVVLNPRRSDWQASWSESASHPEFSRQVQWELEGMESADWILVVFPSDSQAPVSLIELGIRSQIGRMHVVCAEGYWRKANVDLVCARYRIPVHLSIAEAVNVLRSHLKSVQ